MSQGRNEQLRAVVRRLVEALPDAFAKPPLTGSVSRGDAGGLSDVGMLLAAGIRAAGMLDDTHLRGAEAVAGASLRPARLPPEPR